MSSPSAPLSNTDAAFLYRFGNDLAEDNVQLIIETALIALYSVIFASAIYSFVSNSRKGVRTRAAFIMLCVVIYLYVVALVLWVLNVVTLYRGFHTLLMDNNNTPLPDRPALADKKNIGFFGAMEALFLFNMIVGDSVLLWRTWVIYFCRRHILWFPGLLWLTSFVALCNTPTNLISWAFSLGTNLVCTALVGVQAWKHRRMTRFLHMHKSRTDQILSLLVESGFIYCLLWIPQVITYLDTPRTNHALFYPKMVMDGFSDQISGMYPTLIVVIVNLRYTIQWEEADSRVSRDNTRTMRFANPSSLEQHGGDDVFAVQLDDGGASMEITGPGREESKGFKEV
ncbi:hypothetical protein MVEN_01976500 [Mycena venus]|uniref:Uncharacterized protein n=1 Tax=Mycena venus TaxID=2733690 RepID=A0A8H6XCV9_9AGAR|nr:hypothetical protein MVEN_01976500 [Mycena venus]